MELGSREITPLQNLSFAQPNLQLRATLWSTHQLCLLMPIKKTISSDRRLFLTSLLNKTIIRIIQQIFYRYIFFKTLVEFF